VWRSHLERLERASDDALNDTELRHPHPLWRPCQRILLALYLTIAITLYQVPPPKTKYQKDRLCNCVKHAWWSSVPAIGLKRVDIVLEEAAQHTDSTACFFATDEDGTRDERRDVAGGGGAGNLGLCGFQQGVGNELAEEKICKGGIARGEPEEEELGIARFEGAEDSAGEDGEECMELCELRRAAVFWFSG
jgi:hypothetical protein